MSETSLYPHFIEFSRLKLAIDGSDSYIMGAVLLALESDDPYWYAGCFSTFYAPPAQEVFVNRWSRRAVLDDPEAVLEWCIDHWQGLPLSGARRVNRMGPHKLVNTLVGYAKWLEHGGITMVSQCNAFDAAFKTLLKGVPNHGRYTGLKLYETLRRVGARIPTVTDIRPNGAHTPRKALASIFDEHDYHINRGAALEEANTLSDILRLEIPTTWFNVEMLLCNFLKAVKGTYYPGHALDRELDRVSQVRTEFGLTAGEDTTRVRSALYRSSCLGEANEWTGVRKHLQSTFPKHGYMWSDISFNYGDTIDLGSPVKRRARKFKPLIGKGEERI